MQKSNQVKVQTYCPVDAVDQLRLAIGDAGAGVIGNYSHCTFVTAGHGYFLPLEGANPTIGKQGSIEKVEEMKVEFVCDKEKLQDIVEVIKQNHPYEEVPIEVFEMIDF
jgi:hypothetical protein